MLATWSIKLTQYWHSDIRIFFNLNTPVFLQLSMAIAKTLEEEATEAILAETRRMQSLEGELGCAAWLRKPADKSLNKRFVRNIVSHSLQFNTRTGSDGGPGHERTVQNRSKPNAKCQMQKRSNLIEEESRDLTANDRRKHNPKKDTVNLKRKENSNQSSKKRHRSNVRSSKSSEDPRQKDKT